MYMLKRTCFSVVTRQGATLAPAKNVVYYVPLQKFSFLFNLLFLANEKNKLKTTPTHFGTNETNIVQDNRLGLRFHDL